MNEKNINKYDTRKKIIDINKIGDKLSIARNVCHYCKNTLTVKDSKACTNKKDGTKKKSCNKNFCLNCLANYFPKFLEQIDGKEWKCPCCMDECECTSCTKIKNKSHLSKNAMSSPGKTKSFEYHSNLSVSSFESNDEVFELMPPTTTFDWNYLTKYLGKFNKEKCSSIPRPKLEIISEQMVAQYEKKRDDYLNYLREYNSQEPNPYINIEKLKREREAIIELEDDVKMEDSNENLGVKSEEENKGSNN